MHTQVLHLLLQPEIPKPTNTAPHEEWGWYTMQEFFLANWFYITIVVIFALIVFFYTRYKQRNRKK